MPSSFAGISVQVASVSSGFSWSASPSSSSPHGVVAHGASNNDRLLGSPDDDVLMLNVISTAKTPGVYTWTATAYHEFRAAAAPSRRTSRSSLTVLGLPLPTPTARPDLDTDAPPDPDPDPDPDADAHADSHPRADPHDPTDPDADPAAHPDAAADGQRRTDEPSHGRSHRVADARWNRQSQPGLDLLPGRRVRWRDRLRGRRWVRRERARSERAAGHTTVPAPGRSGPASGRRARPRHPDRSGRLRMGGPGAILTGPGLLPVDPHRRPGDGRARLAAARPPQDRLVRVRRIAPPDLDAPAAAGRPLDDARRPRLDSADITKNGR